MKKNIIITITLLLLTIGFAQAVVIAEWWTYDETNDKWVGRFNQEYKVTGRLASYPINYDKMPLVINEISPGEQLIMKFDVWSKPDIGWIDCPCPHRIYGTAKYSLNGGEWQPLQWYNVENVVVHYAEVYVAHYTLNLTIPENMNTFVIWVDSNFHIHPGGLEADEPVLIFFEAPETNLLTGDVVGEYKSKGNALTGNYMLMSIFDYNEYGTRVEGGWEFEKTKPTNLFSFIGRTHENVVDYGKLTGIGSIGFTTVFYLFIIGIIFSLAVVSRQVRKKVMKGGK